MSWLKPTSPFLSSFTWLPSVFRVAGDGLSTRILGYINNLSPRSEHRLLYSAIERIFSLGLPLLDAAMNEPLVVMDSPAWQRWKEREPGGSEAMGVLEEKLAGKHGGEWEERHAPKVAQLQPEWENEMRGAYDLKGKDLKVIVKVRLCLFALGLPGPSLTPTSLPPRSPSTTCALASPTQDLGTSKELCVVPHGVSSVLTRTLADQPPSQPHEQIAASLIYYFDTDDAILDEGLALRRVRLEHDVPTEMGQHADDFTLFVCVPSACMARAQPITLLSLLDRYYEDEDNDSSETPEGMPE